MDELEHFRFLQRVRGLCSEPDCEQPISGWCATCDAQGAFKAPKWCERHLTRHTLAAGHQPYWIYRKPGGAA